MSRPVLVRRSHSQRSEDETPAAFASVHINLRQGHPLGIRPCFCGPQWDFAFTFTLGFGLDVGVGFLFATANRVMVLWSGAFEPVTVNVTVACPEESLPSDVVKTSASVPRKPGSAV